MPQVEDDPRMKFSTSIHESSRTDILSGSSLAKEARPSRAFVAAENMLLRDTLARVLSRCPEIDIAGVGSVGPELPVVLRDAQIEIVLLCPKSTVDVDIRLIHQLRSEVPELRIVLMHRAKTGAEFLESVRAGIQGYLTEDASAKEVVDAIHKIHAGEAVCPGPLCLQLFRYIERGPRISGPCHERMMFTPRQHQLMPFVEQGLSNKEIANRLSVSEQTVKNHLYRMKKKIGAEDRLGIVHAFRVRGLLPS
jgi:DNA-binding NarL/FixJ family response regulator